MAGKSWSHEARRAYWIKRLGEEKGEERFQKFLEKESSKRAEPVRADFQPQSAELPPARGESEPAGPKGRKKQKVTALLGVSLAVTDKTVAVVDPRWEPYQATPQEIGAIADALADEILRSNKLTQWILKAEKNSTHLKLFWVLSQYAYPRLVMSGKMPQGLFGGETIPTPEAAVPMESGAAYGAGGTDREREIDFSLGTAGNTSLRSDSQVQGGLGEVPQYDIDAGLYEDGRPQGEPAGFEPAVFEAAL